jgi:hypothetical protein
VVLSDEIQRSMFTARYHRFVMAHVDGFARSCKVKLSSHVGIVGSWRTITREGRVVRT